jgi:hypothetical protein
MDLNITEYLSLILFIPQVISIHHTTMEKNILQNDTPAYIIVPEELGAVRQFLFFQSNYPFSKGFTESIAENYLDALMQTGNSSNDLKNAAIQSWVKSFAVEAMKIKDFQSILVTRKFYQFCSGDPTPNDILERFSQPWTSFWHAFTDGWRWRDSGDYDNYFGPAYPTVIAPKAWKDVADELRGKWGNNPPQEFIVKGGGPDMAKYAEYRNPSKIAVDKWMTENKTKLSTSRTPSWVLQYTAATTIMTQEQLTASDYFFFFHLYIALASGDTSCKSLAKRLFDKKESSIVYKNETFTNHLIYAVLLFLANPDDRCQWDNEKLRNFIQATKNAISADATDEVSVGIKAGLAKFGDLLNRDDGFPFAARGDFNNRLVNTLGKLDKMRKT